MRALSIAQRVMLLQQGLNDRSGNLNIFIYKTLVDFEVKLKGLGKSVLLIDQVNLSFPQPVQVYLGVLYRRHFSRSWFLEVAQFVFFCVWCMEKLEFKAVKITYVSSRAESLFQPSLFKKKCYLIPFVYILL